MLKRIDHIGVIVDDLAEAGTFLRETMGMKLTRTVDVPETGVRGEFYRCGEVDIEVIALSNPADRRRRLGEGNRARIEHIAIEVDDLTSTLKALEGLGVRNGSGAPRKVGASTSIWTDPDSCDGVMYQLMQKE